MIGSKDFQKPPGHSVTIRQISQSRNHHGSGLDVALALKKKKKKREEKEKAFY